MHACVGVCPCVHVRVCVLSMCVCSCIEHVVKGKCQLLDLMGLVDFTGFRESTTLT